MPSAARGNALTSWGALTPLCCCQRSGMVALTPRQFLPPSSPAAGIWCGLAVRRARRAPLSRPSLPFSLSLPRTPSQDSCSRILHARTAHEHLSHAPLRRADTLAHARRHARAHPPPRTLYISNSSVQSACSLSIIHANALEDRAAGATSAVISLSIPNLTKHKDDAPKRFCPFAAAIVPRCCLLGQPVSKEVILNQKHKLPGSK